MLSTETIFAPATAAGRAAIAILRLSGPDTARAVSFLAGDLPPPRAARRRRLVDPATGEPLDDGLVLWFPAPDERHRRGCRGIPCARQPRRARRGYRGAGSARAAPRRAGRIHPPRLSERQARPHPGRGDRRSRRGRDRGAAPPGIAPARWRARRPLSRLVAAADPYPRPSRSRDRLPRRGSAARDRGSHPRRDR